MQTKGLFLVMMSLALVSTALSQGEARLGEIRFVDGKTQAFAMANAVRHDPSYDAEQLQYSTYLVVYFNNRKAQLLFDRIDSLRVLAKTVTDSGVVRGDLEITTIRGMVLTTPISVSDIVVTIYEDSTGAAKEVHFPFAKDEKLFIRSIVFPKGSSGL